jgi:Fe2+ transport system protein FeoA
MGITPGTRILLIKTAPMGDPLEITLRGFNLSIRKEDARYIELKMDSPEEESND